jgi:dTDP-4-dehydrorhamnose 3,5-epimerase
LKFTTTPLEGLLIIEPRVFTDDRGYFFESFNQKEFDDATGLHINFVQDNQSLSQTGTLRGLHLQKPPFAQGKLVRVLQGSALDVAVDVREKSPTYGQHFKIELNATNNLQLWVPPGFAHGFITLSDDTIFTYKVTNYYDKASEDGVIWNDAHLNIDWGTREPQLSEKDEIMGSFADFQSPF